MNKRYIIFIFFSLMIFSSSNASAYSLNLSFTNINGDSSKISDYQGKKLLIDAMATWCEPCKIEMGHLYEVYKYAKEEVNILSVSVSPGTDDLDGIKKFKTDVESDSDLIFTWDFGLDKNEDFINQFDISFIPTLILLDENGNQLERWEEVTEPQVILEKINSSIEYSGPAFNLGDNLLQNPLFLIFTSAMILLVIYVKLVPKKVIE